MHRKHHDTTVSYAAQPCLTASQNVVSLCCIMYQRQTPNVSIVYN